VSYKNTNTTIRGYYAGSSVLGSSAGAAGSATTSGTISGSTITGTSIAAGDSTFATNAASSEISVKFSTSSAVKY
jgi:hypothetical protein